MRPAPRVLAALLLLSPMAASGWGYGYPAAPYAGPWNGSPGWGDYGAARPWSYGPGGWYSPADGSWGYINGGVLPNGDYWVVVTMGRSGRVHGGYGGMPYGGGRPGYLR